MDYYPLPEPEPEPANEICYTSVNTNAYLLMCFGAGIGYFMMGGFLSMLCCEKRERDNGQIILANQIPI